MFLPEVTTIQESNDAILNTESGYYPGHPANDVNQRSEDLEKTRETRLAVALREDRPAVAHRVPRGEVRQPREGGAADGGDRAELRFVTMVLSELEWKESTAVGACQWGTHGICVPPHEVDGNERRSAGDRERPEVVHEPEWQDSRAMR